MRNRRAQPTPPVGAENGAAVLDASGRRALGRRLAFVGAALFVLGALAFLWLATPLREWVDVERLVAVLNRFGDSPWALPVLLMAYLAGGLVLFPVNVLVAVTVVVFGPLLGGAYAVAGSLASAALLYEIGRGLRAGVLRKRLTPRLRLLGARLARRGLPAIVFVRIVPVAPYSVVNLVAGAARIRRRDYLLGTALGMLPGIIVDALFVDRVVALIERPQWTTLGALVIVPAAALALLYVVRRRVAQFVRRREPA